MQWRQPPDRTDRLYADVVEFGRGRSRSSGYLAHSDRVGPGVLVLDPRSTALADALNTEGFTALVPDRPLEDLEPGALEAAAAFLSENWHPRLGVIAAGDAGVAAAGVLAERAVTLDALALIEGRWNADPPETALIGHYSNEGGPTTADSLFEAVAASGFDVELFVYDEPSGFWDRRSENFSTEATALVDARTLDALEYHLS
jgi:hypothetical protein